MRRFYFLITAFFVLFNVAAEKPKVVASASMIADMATQIAGELIELSTIVPIGGDPHLHEPTPRDAQIISRAQLILVNGLTFEGWIAKLINNSGTQANIVTVTQGLQPLNSIEYANSADPHAWMTAQNGQIYIQNIRDALIHLIPEHKTIIEENYVRYKNKLSELETYISKSIQTIPPAQRVLITSHDAFQYYGRHYGLQLEAIVGISTESEAQTSDIMRVNRVIQEFSIPAIFVESTINPKLIQQIAQDNQITIGGKLFADSLDEPEKPAGSYVGMLKHNTDTIVSALSISKEKKLSEGVQQGINWPALLVIGGCMLLTLGVVMVNIHK